MAYVLGGGSVDAGWKTPTTCYRFSTQRHDEKSVSKVGRGLTGARDKITVLNFNGTLELYGAAGSERELDKYQFLSTIKQLTLKHGRQVFYAIKKGGTIYHPPWSIHLISIEDVIDSHVLHNDGPSIYPSKYDEYEKGYIDMSRLVVESILTDKMKDTICTRYDHDPSFHNYPVFVLFMMSLDILCNASQSFDID
jgi:hypothetical protein